ncbi:MAG: hypothetical protein WBA61_17025 [Aequorivita sp.]
MKKFLLTFGLTLVLFSMSVTVQAQSKPQDVFGQKVEATRGAQKHERPDDNVQMPKPDKSRGACCLNFDNYTGYYIDVWVDDVYRGRVSAYDEGNVCVYDGYTTWYAETAGGTYYWNGKGECQGSFNIKLN